MGIAVCLDENILRYVLGILPVPEDRIGRREHSPLVFKHFLDECLDGFLAFLLHELFLCPVFAYPVRMCTDEHSH